MKNNNTYTPIYARTIIALPKNVLRIAEAT